MSKLIKKTLNNKYFRSLVVYPLFALSFLASLLIWFVFFGRATTEDGVGSVASEAFYVEQSGDYGRFYDDFLNSSYKKSVTREDFIKQYADYPKIEGGKMTINEVTFTAKDRALVDRTVYCPDEKCLSTRAYRLYIKEGNRWLLEPRVDIWCPNTEPYELVPEFERSLSLIEQRMSSVGYKYTEEYVSSLRKVRNCLNIQYADEDFMDSADGMFSFVEGQSPKELNILVSPKYVSKDDLLTAVLLAHEVSHAMDYVMGLRSGVPFDCYETEARAFFAQNAVFVSLNQEERTSIIARATRNYSAEAVDVVGTFLNTTTYDPETYMDNIRRVVKASKVYQEQCSR